MKIIKFISNIKLPHYVNAKNVALAIFWLFFLGYFALSLTKPLYQDEGVFLTIGKGIATGKLPYLDFWDHKPPGIYLAFASLYPLFKTNLIFYKLFIWLVNILTGILVFSISEKISKKSGPIAILVFLISLIFFEGNYLNAGPFLGFFGALSIWFVMQYPQKWYGFVGSGASIALALIFKQTALFGILPITIFALSRRGWTKLLYLAGFGVPLALTAIYLNQVGALQEFWRQLAASSSSYPPEPLRQVLLAWLDVFKRVWWLIPGVVLAFFRKKFSGAFWLVVFMAFLPVLTFFVRSYPHYWLQVLPYLAILAGIGWQKFSDFFNQRRLTIVTALVVVVALTTTTGNLLWYKWITENKSRPRATEQGAVIERLKELDSQYLLAENRFTGYHFFLDSEPLNRYLYLTEVNESDAPRELTLIDLRTKDDVVVVWPKDQEFVYAKEIGEWLTQNYNIVAEYPVLDLVIYQRPNAQ